ITTIALTALAVGCTEDKTVPSPQERPDASASGLVAPGEASEELAQSELSFETDVPGAGDDEVTPYRLRLCEHARLNGTTVIAEVLSGGQNLTEGVSACDSPYSHGAASVPIKVLGNVAGTSLPEEMETTI